MSYVIINGNKYDIPEVDFDAVCELEEMGVNLLAQNKEKPQIATIVRGFSAWIMGVDVQTASREIESHIANGGNVLDILSKVTDAVTNSGFFAQNRQKQPQDHKSKGGGNVKQYPGNNQNRARRRSNQRNRNNRNHR